MMLNSTSTRPRRHAVPVAVVCRLSCRDRHDRPTRRSYTACVVFTPHLGFRSRSSGVLQCGFPRMGLESCSAPAIDLSRALRCKPPAQANGGSDLARTGLALYSAHYGKMAGKWACLAGLSAYPTRAFLGVPNAEFPGPAVLPSSGSFSRTRFGDLALGLRC